MKHSKEKPQKTDPTVAELFHAWEREGMISEAGKHIAFVEIYPFLDWRVGAQIAGLSLAICGIFLGLPTLFDTLTALYQLLFIEGLLLLSLLGAYFLRFETIGGKISLFVAVLLVYWWFFLFHDLYVEALPQTLPLRWVLLTIPLSLTLVFFLNASFLWFVWMLFINGTVYLGAALRYPFVVFLIFLLLVSGSILYFKRDFFKK